jgi:thiopurine S-methyltransferase
MEHDFWSERWSRGQLGFHLAEVNPHLVAHVGALLPADAPPPARVLVPLCGKTRDLAWLRARGPEVVGVEFVEQAALSFFDESGLEPAVTRLGPHPVVKAEGITIVLDDFLTLDVNAVGRFSAIYDRAALVALEPANLPAYLRKVRSLCTDDARVLLVTFDHDLGNGPPFSVPEAELRRLCEGLFTLDHLAELDILPKEPRFRERGAKRLYEQVFLARPVVPAR